MIKPVNILHHLYEQSLPRNVGVTGVFIHYFVYSLRCRSKMLAPKKKTSLKTQNAIRNKLLKDRVVQIEY